MADTEYIEITSSEITEAKKDLDKQKEQLLSEVSSDDTPSEIEIIEQQPDSADSPEHSDLSGEQEVEEQLSLPDVENESKPGVESSYENIDSTVVEQPAVNQDQDTVQESSEDIEVHQKTDADSSPIQQPTTMDTLENQLSTVGASSGNYEVIGRPEEQNDDVITTVKEEAEPTKQEQSASIEEKPSPFQRFRSFTKQEKKDAGSSITLPSIFSDISTSFMSLKNIGKRKESSTDDAQPASVNPDVTPSPTSATNVEQLRIERKNLLGMAKLSIKGLIESSLGAGHTLDSDHTPLQQFFVIMEAVLRHGLKSPKLFFTGNKQFWGPLEAIEKLGDAATEITNSVRELPGIKTHAGRARAWLRLALMQKRLADYFKMMIENREAMSEFYDVEAFVLTEEGVVLSGHLVGLNCIDANLCMKGDDLDNQNAVIDYSLYIKDGNRSISSDLNLEAEETKEEEVESETAEEKMRKLANQKNYLEERNRYLETTLSELKKSAGSTSSSNELLEAELGAAKISLTALREEKEKLIEEKAEMAETHKRILSNRQLDLDTERQTLVQSRASLDEMLNQVKKQLKQEALMRMDVERELELQISLKQELEVAMKLLEKDIYDKQDSLVILREQLDSVKGINIDIYKKLQDKTDTLETKSKEIQELENETKRLEIETKKLKEKVGEANKQLDNALDKADRLSQNLDDSEKRRNALETNLKIEREWRMALEQKDEKSANQITQLQTELSMLQLLKQELQDVKNERDELKVNCEEQEHTINDLADHLGKSKQNFQDLKDVHRSVTEKTWEKDKEVKNCTQCEKPFNLSRRKHHCRNCGQIFCNTCSDNTMPLASSSKPMRVCDACHTVLLQRYNAQTP